MDTSEQYFKMSNCPEVQDEYFNIPKMMAYFYSVDADFVYANYEKPKDKDCEDWWCPTQDQIQEMMKSHTQPQYLIMSLVMFMQSQQKFYKKRKAKRLYPIGSMEQLWLAFYMFKNHQKFWNSKEQKWIKSE